MESRKFTERKYGKRKKYGKRTYRNKNTIVVLISMSFP